MNKLHISYFIWRGEPTASVRHFFQFGLEKYLKILCHNYDVILRLEVYVAIFEHLIDIVDTLFGTRIVRIVQPLFDAPCNI